MDPLTIGSMLAGLGGGGGGGGFGALLGGVSGLLGGGKTEVNQNVSQTASLVGVTSVNNTVGKGSAQSGNQTPDVTQTATASSTAASPQPVYSATTGADYSAGSFAALDATAAAPAAPQLAGFNPVFVIGGLALAAWLFLKEK